MSELQLTEAEARVIGALTEKSMTTPDYYPMTVNGLMAACNQKTSRYPVMSLSEGEVGHALSTLEEKGLVSRDESSARAIKWRSKLLHQLLLKPATIRYPRPYSPSTLARFSYPPSPYIYNSNASHSRPASRVASISCS